jgi:gliding motility-associated-like protein
MIGKNIRIAIAGLAVIMGISGSLNAQTFHVVDSAEDGFAPTNGTTTLRMALSVANPGDTILIDVTGELRVNSTLVIDKGVKIKGPSPARFRISGSILAVGNMIEVNTGNPADTLIIDGIGIVDQNNGQHALVIQSTSNVVIANSVVKDNNVGTPPSFGGAFLVSGELEMLAVSVVNNEGFEGGAIYTDPGSEIRLKNCHFENNIASVGDGGAIYSRGEIHTENCTFYQNQASNSGGAIRLDTSSVGAIGRSIFYQNTSTAAPNVRDISGAGVVSAGYNMLIDNSGCTALFVSGVSSDLVGAGLFFGLRTSGSVTDGYGMVWLPIVDAASNAVSKYTTSTLTNDIRRAPRILTDENGGNYLGDIGAVEFTPFRVLNNSGSSGTSNSFPWCMNRIATNSVSPAYVEFDFGTVPAVISSSAQYDINTSNVYIDGFTQTGSLVPGPTDWIDQLTAGFHAIEIQGTLSANPGFNIVAAAINTRISGLLITNYNTGIISLADDLHVFGCSFGMDATGTQVTLPNNRSVEIQFGYDGVVGGVHHYHRNLFSGHNSQGLIVGNGSDPHFTTIQNNIFGLDGMGSNLPTGAILASGIYLNQAASSIITENIISGNDFGLEMVQDVSTVVVDNIFGADASASAAIPNQSFAIRTDASASPLLGTSTEGNRFISTAVTSPGIVIDNNTSNAHIENNLMGVFSDGISFSGCTNAIEVLNNSTNTIIRGNVINGSDCGIHLAGGSTFTQVHSNLIGLTAAGTAIPGASNSLGIRMLETSQNDIGSTATPNFISNNVGNGIELNDPNCTMNNIVGNGIGVESNYTTAAANGGAGIAILSGANNNIVGAAGGGNLIANNGADGVIIDGGASSNQLFGNTIRDNTDGVVVSNSSSTNNIISQNNISNNSGLGIALVVGANDSILTPSISSVSECGPGVFMVEVDFSGMIAGFNYVVEFFGIPAGQGDPSGFGEGNTYTESHGFMAPAAGSHTQLFTLSGAYSVGDLISCTVTDQTDNTSQFSNHIQIEPTPTISLDFVVDETCSGSADGSIDISVSGFGSPSFFWQNSAAVPMGITEDISGLTGDTYTIDVTFENGCVVSDNYFVNTGAYPFVNGHTTSNYNGFNISCSGASDGSIDLDLQGGYGSFNVSIDNGLSFPFASVSNPFNVTGLPAGVYDIWVQNDNGTCAAFYASISLSEPSTLAVTGAILSNPLCNGDMNGSAVAAPVGAVGTVYYSWSNGETTPTAVSLSAGVSTITITDDNGCMAMDNVSLIDPAPVVVSSYSTVEPNCFGDATGSIQATGITGGTAPYFISTDNGGTFQATDIHAGIFAGPYTCLVMDNNGCQSVTSLQNVTEPTQLLSAATASPESCAGLSDGTLDLTVFGGTPGYTVTWYSDPGYSFVAYNGPNVSGVAPGTYYPEVVDNNFCSHYDVSVDVFSASPIFTAFGTTDPICFGDSNGSISDVGTSGGAGSFTFSWYSDAGLTMFITSGSTISGLPAGDYYVVVEDMNFCQQTDMVSLVDPLELTVTTNSFSDPTCNGFANGTIDVTAVGGIGPFEFSNNNGSTFSVPQAGGNFSWSALAAGTYDIIIRDANGCQGTTSVVLTDPPAVGNPVAGSNSPLCEGDNLNLTATLVTGATYLWTGPSAYTSTLQNPTIAVVTAAQAGTYTVVANVGGCSSAPSNTVVVIDPIPVFTVTVASQPSTCGGTDGSVLISGLAPSTAYILMYDTPSPVNYGAFTTNATGSFTVTGLSAGTYTNFQVTSGAGCANVDPGPHVLSDPVPPSAPIASNSSPVCEGGIINLSSSFVAGATYSWTGPNGFTSALQNPTIASATLADAGTFQVTATVAGCTSGADSTIVVVNLQDDATITPTGPLCDSDAPVFLAAVTGGGIWSASCGACIIATSGEFDPTVAGGGVHNITYATTGACPDSNVETITVNPFQDPTITPAGPFCPGDAPVNLSAATAGGTWSGTGITSAVLGTFDPSVAGPGTFSISHTTAGACGGTDVENIIVVSPDLVDAGADGSTCQGVNYAINGSFTSNGASGIIWGSTGTGSFTSPTSLSSAYIPGAGETGTITVYISTVGGTCGTVSDSLLLTINPTEDGSFVFADFCAGTSPAPVVTGTTGGTFSWLVTPGGGESIDPSTGIISGAVGGTVYQVEYTTPGTCQATGTQSPTAFSLPGLSVTTTNPSCTGSTDGDIFITPSGTGPFDVSIDNGSTTFPTASTYNFNGLAAGIYTSWVMDINGCINSQTTTLTATSQPTVSVVGVDISCFGAADDTITVTALSGTGPFDFYLNGGGPYSGSNPLSWTGFGPGTFQVWFDDAAGCRSDTASVTINEPPQLILTAGSVAADTCGFSSGVLVASVSGGTTPYGYSLNGANFQLNGTYSNLAAGNYLVGVSDVNGCIASQIANIPVLNVSLDPFINASAAFSNVCPGTAVQLNAAGGFSAYNWTSGTVSDPAIANPLGSVNAGVNVFVVSAQYGSCVGADSVLVYGDDSQCGTLPDITNAFSPDGDGINDTWTIDDIASSPNNTVTIFNRWGDLLRTFENYDNVSVAWDGKNGNGAELTDGTYYFIIEYRDLQTSRSGWVYITR